MRDLAGGGLLPCCRRKQGVYRLLVASVSRTESKASGHRTSASRPYNSNKHALPAVEMRGRPWDGALMIRHLTVSSHNIISLLDRSLE